MARKITTAAIEAFMSGRPFKRDNTTVEKVGRNLVLCLYGNVIASRDDFENMGIAAAIRVTDAGFPTATTKERLNGIPGVSVCQRKGAWFLNGQKWGGGWTQVEHVPDRDENGRYVTPVSIGTLHRANFPS